VTMNTIAHDLVVLEHVVHGSKRRWQHDERTRRLARDTPNQRQVPRGERERASDVQWMQSPPADHTFQLVRSALEMSRLYRVVRGRVDAEEHSHTHGEV
jgi:hypothetical protein